MRFREAQKFLSFLIVEFYNNRHFFLSERADFTVSGVLQRICGEIPQLHRWRLPSTANSTRELSR